MYKVATTVLLLFNLTCVDFNSQNSFLNTRSYTFAGCYGLKEFCHNGYVRCRIDCKLMLSKKYCNDSDMPYKWALDKLVKCDE